MTNIQIDSDAVRSLVSRAIIDTIGPEQRELVMQQAVEALLHEPKDNYGQKMADSPLVIAFNKAVREVAQDVVREYLGADPVKQRVRDAITSTVTAMLNEDGGWLYGTIGSAVGERIREIMEGNR